MLFTDSHSESEDSISLRKRAVRGAFSVLAVLVLIVALTGLAQLAPEDVRLDAAIGALAVSLWWQRPDAMRW